MLEYERIDVFEEIDVNKTFSIIGISWIKTVNMSHIFAIVVMI